RILTPRHGVLEGITRKVAMEIAAYHGLSVEVTDVPLETLMEADEVFATTTGGGPVAVTRVDGRIFSNDSAGPITRQIRETYWRWHEDPAMSEPVAPLTRR
ncbi:MAG: aminotransferase class IV, partial [Pseudomonadota bacterium]